MPGRTFTPVSFNKDFALVINGEKTNAKETLEIINPANKQAIAHVPRTSRVQLDTAVFAAKKAFVSWSATPWAERARVVDAIGSIVDQFSQELATLITKEVGKPLNVSLWETGASAGWLHGIAQQTLPEERRETPDAIFTQRYSPLGVGVAIVPWNYPILLLVLKIAPALLTGNTLIVKPSPTTPLTTLKLIELAQQVVPPGVLSVLSGGDELGPWITSHPGIAKIGFTGSTATGKAVLQSAASRITRVSLELGGNDAAIVLPDVDVDAVADSLFWAMFKNSGQVCINAKRMYIHADIYDAMRDALVARAARARIGNGADPETELGPLQNATQFRKLQEYVEDCRAHGYTLHEGGILPTNPDAGYFAPVYIVDNPPDDTRIVREEPFGPICPLLKWSDENNVVQRANDSEYGLAATVWGKDVARAEALADRLDVGTVWVNQIIVLHPDIAFGGHKMSGLGSDGGQSGLLGWVSTKVVTTKKGGL